MPTAREISAKVAAEKAKLAKERGEKIDNLLDIANWNRRMLAKTGDESYGEKVAEVEKEIAKLVEK